MKKVSLIMLALFVAFTIEASVAQTGTGTQTQPKKPATGTTAQQKSDSAKHKSVKGSKRTQKTQRKKTPADTLNKKDVSKPKDTKKP